MKPKSTLRSFLALAGSLLASPMSYGAIYYWDSNSISSGTTTINAGSVGISHANALGTTAGNTTIAGTSLIKGVNATDGTGIGQTVVNSGGSLRLGVSEALNTTANLSVNADSTGTGTFDLAGFNRIFSLNGSNGLTGRGFLRAQVTSP